jgi:hypothetical protein
VGTTIEFAKFAEKIRLKLWEKVGRANWQSFEAAREHVIKLGLRSRSEWQTHITTKSLPPDIPADPRGAYINSGWSGWGDWLGSNTVAPKDMEFFSFDDARQYA